jgi:hypothetical protein
MKAELARVALLLAGDKAGDPITRAADEVELVLEALK